MKFFKLRATIFLVGLLTIGVSVQLSAQDQKYSDAISAFNKALEHSKANEFEQAINMFNQAILLAGQSEYEKAPDIISRTQSQLPSIYYQLAVTRYKDFQKNKNMASLDVAIAAFQETADISEEYGVEDIRGKSGQIVTQLYYTKSILEFNSQNYDAALASLDQAIERNPNYAKAYYQKGLVIKNMENGSLDSALALFDKAIDAGQKANDNATVRQAKEKVSDELIYAAGQRIKNRDFEEAIELLNHSLEYQQSADAYYRLAEAHNKDTNWDQAITNARKALELERGGRTDKAQIYYELAIALKAQGQKTEACSAFSNAAYGSFKAPAEHQMEYELKCEDSTR